jgi:isocitrate dehydrogenase
MTKIAMKTPLVEMDGDEMTRIIWKQIKEIVLEPFIDLKTEYFDLGLEYRDQTDDQVTIDSANRTLELGVAVKCATITPNAQRVEEYKLKQMWKSPNGTIRAILDGTVFRAPILVDCIQPFVASWRKPITIARHAYGDVYRDSEMKVDGPCKAELLLTMPDGSTKKQLIHDFKGLVSCSACTTSTIRSQALPVPALTMPSTSGRISGLPPKTPFPRPTITASRTFSRRSTMPSLTTSSRQPGSNISTP